MFAPSKSKLLAGVLYFRALINVCVTNFSFVVKKSEASIKLFREDVIALKTEGIGNKAVTFTVVCFLITVYKLHCLMFASA